MKRLLLTIGVVTLAWFGIVATSRVEPAMAEITCTYKGEEKRDCELRFENRYDKAVTKAEVELSVKTEEAKPVTVLIKNVPPGEVRRMSFSINGPATATLEAKSLDLEFLVAEE